MVVREYDRIPPRANADRLKALEISRQKPHDAAMTPSKLKTSPVHSWTWDQRQADRTERRRVGNLVAPAVIRREKSEGDEYLRETYGGERGPPFNKPFDSSADEKR